MSALALLYMLDHILAPEVAPSVSGLLDFRRLMEGAAGSLSDQAFATQTLGLFTGLVYFTPIFGGLLADCWLGKRRTVILGAMLLGLGNLAMAFDRTFLVALLAIILGTGCLKGNISTQVSQLYKPEDESRRTRAFVIFSASINLGALLGPLFCGMVAAVYGWQSAFGLASALMLVALGTYISGAAHLPRESTRGNSEASVPMNLRDWGTIALLLLLLLLATFPLAAYYQQFNVIMLFTEESVDRKMFGWQVPTATFISLDGFFGILFVPILVKIWRALDLRSCEPSDAGKVAIGYLVTGLANVMLAVPAARVDAGNVVGIVWPILFFATNAFGFLCYWPTLLAIFARAAPRQVNSTLMGLLFMSLFLGNLIIGHLAGFWEQWSHASFFQVTAMLGIVPGMAMLLAKPLFDQRLAVNRSRHATQGSQ
jgi:POT family proton-dependent oligopeptide transporter